jgi:hypothetical protein
MKHSRFHRNYQTDQRNCTASHYYVLKMVAAYSSETMIGLPNTILRDATSHNTIILKKALLKFLRQNYTGRCDEIRNICYRPVFWQFVFRVSAGTRVTLTCFFRGFLQSFLANVAISSRLVTTFSIPNVSNSPIRQLTLPSMLQIPKQRRNTHLQTRITEQVQGELLSNSVTMIYFPADTLDPICLKYV